MPAEQTSLAREVSLAIRCYCAVLGADPVSLSYRWQKDAGFPPKSAGMTGYSFTKLKNYPGLTSAGFCKCGATVGKVIVTRVPLRATLLNLIFPPSMPTTTL